MATPLHTIKDILALARYEGEPDRVSIFCRIFGLIMENKVDPGAPVYSILLQMMDVLWNDIGISMRIELAKRLMVAPNPPAGLLHRFAVDEIEVATHVLSDETLSDEFLVGVIAQTSRAHHLLIAERLDLSEAVWKAITDRRRAGRPPEGGGTPPSNVKPDNDQNLFSLELGKQNPVRIRMTGRSSDRENRSVPLVEALVAAAMEDVHSENEIADSERSTIDEKSLSWNWRTDRSGAIIDIDERCCAAFGMGPDQLKGLNLFSLVRDASDADVSLAETVERKTPIRNLPIEIEDNFGSSTRWVLSGTAFFEVHDGKFQGYSGRASQGID